MSDRNLRHKTVPVYDDDDEVENEIAGNRTYDVTEKVYSERYNDQLITEMDDGTELVFERIQKEGFDHPIRIKNVEGLGELFPYRLHFILGHASRYRYSCYYNST